MTANCQNCHAALQGKYCSNCGQSANTHKINLHFLWHDIQHGLLHVDKGILFTAKELFTRPGHTLKEFINGKRVKHFKLLSFVLILAGVYGFLFHYFEIDMLANNIKVSGSGEKFNEVKETVSKLSEWVSAHYSIMALLQIPLFAIGTFMAFRKSGYNFIEHLVINAFLTGQRLILHIVAFPLYYFFNGTSTLRTSARITDILGYALMAWSLFQLFNHVSTLQRTWRIALSFIISFLIIFLMLTGAAKYVIATVVQ